MLGFFGKTSKRPPEDEHTEIDVQALYDSPHDHCTAFLRFRRGDRLRIDGDRHTMLSPSTNRFRSRSLWRGVHARNSAKGLVRKELVAPLQNAAEQPWFYTGINRDSALHLLIGNPAAKDLFLVRTSPEDGLVLELKTNAQTVKSFPISDVDDELYIDDSERFKNLHALVQHYLKGNALFEHHPTKYPKRSHYAIEGKRLVYRKDSDMLYSPDIWEIERRQIIFHRKLGQGYFGSVHLARWCNLTVAVKILHSKWGMGEDGAWAAFDREFSELNVLDHPNVLRLFGVCTGETPFYIVTEYVAGGSLLECLTGKNPQIPSDLIVEQAVSVLFQVALGMEYLQSTGKIHRDLAARNILLDRKSGDRISAKVADLGLARNLPEKYYYSGEFPVCWSPPEVLLSHKFSKCSDIWSFGVVVFELYSRGEQPYHKEFGKVPGAVALSHFLAKGQRLAKPDLCLDTLWEQVASPCFEENWNERPTFTEILERLKVGEVASNPKRIRLGWEISLRIKASLILTCRYWDINHEEVVLGTKVHTSPFSTLQPGMWDRLAIILKISNNGFAEHGADQRSSNYGVPADESQCPAWIYMEYFPWGYLTQYVATKLRDKDATWKASMMNNFICQIAKGMEYIQMVKRKIHLNLACHNIMVHESTRGPSVKIASFHFALDMAELQNQASLPYTMEKVHSFGLATLWTPPEAIRYKQITENFDVWSFGVVVIEMFSEERLYKREFAEQRELARYPRTKALATKILEYLESGQRLKRPANCPAQIYDEVVMPCFKYQWRERPNFTNIVHILKRIRFLNE
ncbi:unnamed protein product, partial [Mesorhabditis spiculigera]